MIDRAQFSSRVALFCAFILVILIIYWCPRVHHQENAHRKRAKRETKTLRNCCRAKQRKWRQKKIAFNERFYFQLSIWTIVNDHFGQFTRSLGPLIYVWMRAYGSDIKEITQIYVSYSMSFKRDNFNTLRKAARAIL